VEGNAGPVWGLGLRGMMMKTKWFVVVLLMIGTACSARAQDAGNLAGSPSENVAPDFAQNSAAKVTMLAASNGMGSAGGYGAPIFPRVAAATHESAEPPMPAPGVFTRTRDDYRWQLGFGFAWVRFQSSIFNASGLGANTSLTYYTNEWLAFEGDVTTSFAPTIYVREHVKYLSYTGGVKIGSRREKWEPWAHVLAGGAHVQPQTAGNSRNALAIQAGGGADYRLHSRISLRVEGDWVRTQFFKQTQNNLQLVGGVVIHF
jgi:opacity protein-like surface antigen